MEFSDEEIFAYRSQLQERFQLIASYCNEVYRFLVEEGNPYMLLDVSARGAYNDAVYPLGVAIALSYRGYNIELQSKLNTQCDADGYIQNCSIQQQFLVTSGRTPKIEHVEFNPPPDSEVGEGGILSRNWAERYILAILHWLGMKGTLEELLEKAFAPARALQKENSNG